MDGITVSNSKIVARLSYAAVLVLLIATETSSQVRQLASYKAPDGALLCSLDEDFYSYSRSEDLSPLSWDEVSECCEGQRQSPRNLRISSKSFCNQGQRSSFSYNSTRTISGHLHNDGHVPVVKFGIKDTAYLTNSPFMSGHYVLENIHLHFCTKSSNGSEHAIDGQFYQGEMHLVHYKASYGSLASAVLHEDGLVVIGIMLQPASAKDINLNREMIKLIGKMNDLQGVGKVCKLPVQVKVTGLFPRSQAFFTYAGSMTSPPCSESVRWIVLRDPIKISTREMDILRRLPNGKGGFIGQTCVERPLQSGHTEIKTNFDCAPTVTYG